jgi:hypothetical protein
LSQTLAETGQRVENPQNFIFRTSGLYEETPMAVSFEPNVIEPNRSDARLDAARNERARLREALYSSFADCDVQYRVSDHAKHSALETFDTQLTETKQTLDEFAWACGNDAITRQIVSVSRTFSEFSRLIAIRRVTLNGTSIASHFVPFRCVARERFVWPNLKALTRFFVSHTRAAA